VNADGDSFGDCVGGLARLGGGSGFGGGGEGLAAVGSDGVAAAGADGAAAAGAEGSDGASDVITAFGLVALVDEVDDESPLGDGDGGGDGDGDGGGDGGGDFAAGGADLPFARVVVAAVLRVPLEVVAGAGAGADSVGFAAAGADSAGFAALSTTDGIGLLTVLAAVLAVALLVVFAFVARGTVLARPALAFAGFFAGSSSALCLTSAASSLPPACGVCWPCSHSCSSIASISTIFSSFLSVTSSPP
jgi:hypothetical protein